MVRRAHSSCAPNNIDTKAKCRHLKNLPVKRLCGRCLSEFVVWRYSQSYWYFRPSFVNCCPSNILSVSTLPPYPLPCVNKYTVYTYTMCVGGGVWGYGVLGLSQVNTSRNSPFTSQFFRWRHFALPSMSLIFLRSRWRDGLYASGTVFPLLICRICRRERCLIPCIFIQVACRERVYWDI